MTPAIHVTLVHLSLLLLNICLGIWNNVGCKKKKIKKSVRSKGESKGGSSSLTNKPASTSQSSNPITPFPKELLDAPLAPTQPLEDEVNPNSLQQKDLDKLKDDKKKDKEESRMLLPYPEVKPPTASQKRRRLRELEKDKKEKIASGFYQSRSDEDDTLEKVNSLKEEMTEQSRRLSRRISKQNKEKDREKEKEKEKEKEPDKKEPDKKEEGKDKKPSQPT